MGQTRQLATCLASVAGQGPTTADSIERVVGGMPLVDTLRLIARLVNHEKFGDCDYVYTKQLDTALAALIERADAGECVSAREDAADQRYYEAVAA